MIFEIANAVRRRHSFFNRDRLAGFKYCSKSPLPTVGKCLGDAYLRKGFADELFFGEIDITGSSRIYIGVGIIAVKSDQNVG